ncbi:MAG: Mth938-like domain-containing protein [Rhodobacteraceae bacterium]|nr:Mth938-like domain-containing protein [Paracoccaceae bacterium]
MRLSEVTYPEGHPVEGYGPGFFRVGGAVIRGGLLILPAGPRVWAGYDEVAPILDAAGAVDVLLVGTGSEIAYLPDGWRARLETAGIGVEMMASPAACRSYNVLLGEGRRVALAALAVA